MPRARDVGASLVTACNLEAATTRHRKDLSPRVWKQPTANLGWFIPLSNVRAQADGCRCQAHTLASLLCERCAEVGALLLSPSDMPSDGLGENTDKTKTLVTFLGRLVSTRILDRLPPLIEAAHDTTHKLHVLELFSDTLPLPTRP